MKISLPKDILPENQAPPTDPTLEVLMQALESSSGIAVSSPSRAEAVAFRHRCYRVRRAAILAGNAGFNNLTIHIERGESEWETLIKKLPQQKIRQL